MSMPMGKGSYLVKKFNSFKTILKTTIINLKSQRKSNPTNPVNKVWQAKVDNLKFIKKYKVRDTILDKLLKANQYSPDIRGLK